MYLDPSPTQNPMWNEENRRHEIKKQYKVEIYDSIQCKKPIFVVFTFVQARTTVGEVVRKVKWVLVRTDWPEATQTGIWHLRTTTKTKTHTNMSQTFKAEAFHHHCKILFFAHKTWIQESKYCKVSQVGGAWLCQQVVQGEKLGGWVEGG